MKEGRGRRLFPAAPDRSLLLLKATNTAPHGGGQRIGPSIARIPSSASLDRAGDAVRKADDPTVTRIEVFPAGREMGRNAEQQVVVLAHYTDGRSRTSPGWPV